MIDEREHLERALRLFPAEPGIVERVYRRRDRKQRNRRLGTAVLALVLAAAAIGVVVRAFRTGETRRPVTLPSDPAAWTRVPFSNDPGDQILSMTAGGPGVVAVGLWGDPGILAAGPGIWTSPDGRTWTRVPQGRSGGPIFDVTTGGAGLVAVGTTSGGWQAGNGDAAPVWSSADGVNWSQAPPDPVFRGAWMRAVTSGGPGSVAVGSTLDGPAAWYSVDGTTWRQASFPSPRPDLWHDGQQADAWMQDVAATDGRLVAVGQMGLRVEDRLGKGVRYFPIMWTSSDGLAWTEVPLDEDLFPTWSELRGVAAGPEGFVVVGGIFGPAEPMVWRSQDGLHWELASAGQDAFVSRAGGESESKELYFLPNSVAAGSGGYLAMGGDAWCTYGRGWLCSPAQAAAWTSTDGETWVRVSPDAVLEVGRTTRVEISAVTAWGDRFVGAGAYWERTREGPGVQRIDIWITERPGE